ncbi:MAG: serine O-acetyltransferase EpsC [Verrucomicrobiota bacterium]
MDKRLPSLVDQLLTSYRDCGGINHIDGANLPSKKAVAKLTEDLLDLLFPGFHTDAPVCSDEVPSLTLKSLTDLEFRLQREIAKSYPAGGTDGPSASQQAMKFLEALPELRSLLATDVEAAFDGDPAAKNTDEVMLAYPGIEAIAVYRLAHQLYIQGVALIPRIMTEWAHSRTGIDIHPGAEIGEYFFIDHGTGVVVGETCSIGNRVKVYHGVTLGALSTYGGQRIRGKKRHPTIEDEVTVYPNATILGGDTVVGARSTIGGNVWLVQSVPPDSVVTYQLTGQNIRQRTSVAPDWVI